MGDKMRKTKIYFGGIILLFLILIFVGSLYYQDEKINNDFDYNKFVSYEQKEHNSCFINAAEPTIILRMDDVRAYSVTTPYLVDEIIKKNMSVTLGVIPRSLEKDQKMIKYLESIKILNNIEIAQHGNEHDEDDINITNESLREGNIKIQTILGVVPVTYITPFNKISNESRETISSQFRVISGEEGVLKEGEKVAEIGYTAATYYYGKKENVPLEIIINKCNESLRKTNLCVVMIHPQEYATDIQNPVVLDKNKFEEFKHLLNKLESLNASFSRFADVVYCSN